MNLIIFDQQDIRDGTISLTGRSALHVTEILQKTIGDRVRCGMVDGPLGDAVITAIDSATVTLTDFTAAETPERSRVSMLLAAPRPKVMQRLWRQLASAGVDEVVITNANKVERFYFDAHTYRTEGYRQACLEGLMQAVDTRMPKVSFQLRLKPYIEQDLEAAFPRHRRILVHPGSFPRLRHVLTDTDRTSPVLLALGPEGGWTNYEVDLFTRHGFAPATLGPRIYRSDEAALIAVYLAHEATAADAE